MVPCQAGLQLPTREAQVICISWGGAETGLQGHWGSYANISSYQCKAGESQLGKRTHWQEIWVCYVWFWIFAIEAKLDAKLECKSITWQHHPKGHKQQQQRTYNKPQLKHLCTLNNLVQRCSKCAQGEVDHEKNQNRIGDDSPACGNPAGIEWNSWESSQVRNGSFLNQFVNQFSTNYLQDCVCSGQFLQVKLDIRISISGEIRVPNASESKKEEKKTMRNEAYGILNLNWTWTTRIQKILKDLVKNPERKLAWWNLVGVFLKGGACVSSKSEVQNDSCTAIITNPITTLNSNLSSICGRSGKPIVTQSLVVSEVKPLSNRGCILGTSSKDVLAIATSTKRCNSLSLYSSLQSACAAMPCHVMPLSKKADHGRSTDLVKSQSSWENGEIALVIYQTATHV